MPTTQRDRERVDDLIVSENGLGNVLRLVLPGELEPPGRNHWAGYSKPGVWLVAAGKGRSPAAHPVVEGRLLMKSEALAIAAVLDGIGHPRSHFDRDDAYPKTYVAFLERWYELLGERLPVAIEAVEQRRVELRELRAALTGEVK